MEEQNINSIHDNFTARNNLVSIFEQLFLLINLLNQNDKINSTPKSEEVNSKLLNSLNELIKRLWEISVENNYYWHNCPSKVYEVFYYDYKDYFIKTYGKRRFYHFLENEMNGFLHIQKSNNPKDKLNFPNNLLQDVFILLDYYKYLTEENKFIIKIFNNSKIEFLKKEIEKDGYYVENYETYFIVKKFVSRLSKGSSSEIQNASSTTHHIENVNIINIDDKAFPLGALNKLLNNFDNLVNKNNDFEEYTEQELRKKGLPKFNVLERFELFKLIGGKKLIDNKIDLKMHKNLLLGISMDLSPDTTKKLQDGTYPKETDRKIVRAIIEEAKNKVQDYLEERHIKIKN